MSWRRRQRQLVMAAGGCSPDSGAVVAARVGSWSASQWRLGLQIAASGRVQRRAALVCAGAGAERGLRAERGPVAGPAGCGAQGVGARLHRADRALRSATPAPADRLARASQEGLAVQTTVSFNSMLFHGDGLQLAFHPRRAGDFLLRQAGA